MQSIYNHAWRCVLRYYYTANTRSSHDVAARTHTHTHSADQCARCRHTKITVCKTRDTRYFKHITSISEIKLYGKINFTKGVL